MSSFLFGTSAFASRCPLLLLCVAKQKQTSEERSSSEAGDLGALLRPLYEQGGTLGKRKQKQTAFCPLCFCLCVASAKANRFLSEGQKAAGDPRPSGEGDPGQKEGEKRPPFAFTLLCFALAKAKVQ